MFIVKFYVKMSKYAIDACDNRQLYELTFVIAYVNSNDMFR
jgi:hypothetical protein